MARVLNLMKFWLTDSAPKTYPHISSWEQEVPWYQWQYFILWDDPLHALQMIGHFLFFLIQLFFVLTSLSISWSVYFHVTMQILFLTLPSTKITFSPQIKLLENTFPKDWFYFLSHLIIRNDSCYLVISYDHKCFPS